MGAGANFLKFGKIIIFSNKLLLEFLVLVSVFLLNYCKVFKNYKIFLKKQK